MRGQRYVFLICLGWLACAEVDEEPASNALADERAVICERTNPRNAEETRDLLDTGDAAPNCRAARSKYDEDERRNLCAWPLLLNREAAKCIAAAAGFRGTSEPRTLLEYDRDRRRPVWTLQSAIPADSPTSEREVVTMTIDAQTGAVLESGGWSEIP